MRSLIRALALCLVLVSPAAATLQAPWGPFIALVDSVSVHVGFTQNVSLTRQVGAPFPGGVGNWSNMVITDYAAPGFIAQRLVVFYDFQGGVSVYSILVAPGLRYIASQHDDIWSPYQIVAP